MRAWWSAVRLTGASACVAVAFLTSAGCGDKSKNVAPDAAAVLDAGDVADGAPALPVMGGGIDAGQAFEDTAVPGAGDELGSRMRHLLEAIVQDNPDLAGDVLFPRDACLKAKDAADPAKFWDKRLSQGFRNSVTRTHARTKGVAHARFVSFELGKAPAQVVPKKKDWKLPLWRVRNSKLTYSIDGKTHHLIIAEMMAWRGAWYVTRIK